VAELAALGTAARALPLIEILPAPDPAQVEQAFAQAEASAAGAVFMFVSPNAVQGFFDAVAARRGVDARTLAWPVQARAAATGPGTVAALRECGVAADAIVAPDPAAQQFDSESLWSEIADWSWPGRPVWIVRGNGGRDWLGRQLRDAGADVRFVQSYGRAAPVLSADEQALLDAALAAPARWIWMFSSSEAIDHLQALGPGAQWAAGRALASHPRIAERALALGFGSVTLVAPAAAAVSAAVASAHRPG
jgi:uroporphyrinogen-III synthase